MGSIRFRLMIRIIRETCFLFHIKKTTVVWYIWRVEWFVMALVALIDADYDPSVKLSSAVLFDHSREWSATSVRILNITYNKLV